MSDKPQLVLYNLHAYIYTHYIALPDIPIKTEGFRHRGTYESTTLTSLAPSAHPLEAPRPTGAISLGEGQKHGKCNLIVLHILHDNSSNLLIVI